VKAEALSRRAATRQAASSRLRGPPA
jgi:hypothetical protein